MGVNLDPSFQAYKANFLKREYETVVGIGVVGSVLGAASFLGGLMASSALFIILGLVLASVGFLLFLFPGFLLSDERILSLYLANRS